MGWNHEEIEMKEIWKMKHLKLATSIFGKLIS
jgi:hypothetical protein